MQVTDDDLVESTETIPLQATVVGGVAVGTFTASRDMTNIEIIDDDGEDIRIVSNGQKNSSQCLISCIMS